MGGIVLDTGAFYLQRALASVVFSEIALGDLGDHKHYEPGAVANRYWDSGVAPTIEKQINGEGDWIAVDTGDYTVSYWPGMLTFTVALGADDLVRASGKKYTVTVLAGASECSLDLSKEAKENTDFQSGKDREYVPGLRGGTGTVSQFFAQTDLANLSALLVLGGKLFAVFYQYIGTTRYRIEGEGVLTGIPVDMSVGEVITSKIGWTFTGPIVRTYDPDYS